MSDILYKLISKVKCDKNGTAFLINEDTAITARHTIENTIKNNEDIFLEFFIETNFTDNKVEAKVLFESEEFDIAVLKLSVAATHISEWLELSSQQIEKTDNWESVGFPINWSESKEGSKFCYLKGEIYNVTTIDSTIYDIDLSSTYIKDEWEYDLGGLSGAPIVIDGKIKAIVLTEDVSLLKSAIKAISVHKIISFFNEHNIKTGSLLGDKNNLINQRLDRQKKTCNDLFKKIDYKKNDLGVNLQIDSYHIKYNEDGKNRVNELSDYLVRMMIDYANSLEDIHKAEQNRMFAMDLYKKTSEAISKMKDDKNLGTLFLWTIAEGILKAPKVFSRISLDDTNHIYTDVHIGINDSKKLVLNLGVGKLNVDLKSAVIETIEIIEELKNIEGDIFVPDDYILKQMEPSPLKKMIEDFSSPLNRKWENVDLEIIVFTGYNSMFINKIENQKFTQSEVETIIATNFMTECVENETIIFDHLSTKNYFKEIKISWFVLPFNTIGSFENTILEMLP
ncbi:Hachiman antiphage defense system protein HamA [Lysinibacillus sp. RS5]|uniref:Hachiman antiphage defense system protein HamA n=1 Tax=unclassified Lysinibacillus TaxID=2636778 RepID=UPI0035BE4213